MFNINANKLLLASAVCLVSGGAAAVDGPLFRHAADYFKFDRTEFVTTITAANTATLPTTLPDGALFYRKTVMVPAFSNVLFVSFFTTGDAHGGAKDLFSCRLRIGGPSAPLKFCRPTTPPIPPGTGVDTAPNGWITLLHVPRSSTTTNCNDGGGGTGDCHDNGISYQWCVQIPDVPVRVLPIPVIVDLKMATSIPGQPIFIEKGHVYIDSSRMEQSNRCTSAPGVSGLTASVESSDPLAAELKAAAATEVVAGSTDHHGK